MPITRPAFVRSLIDVFEGQMPSLEDLTQRANVLAPLMGFAGDVGGVIEDVRISMDTRMNPGESIVDQKSPHDEGWVDALENSIEWEYTNAYGMHLRQQGWSPVMVSALEDGTRRILSLLQNPRDDTSGSWARRGLVIGHVQSGKTANYTGVIARAADAGYRFIVVIAGIHNNLRKQTQERIEQGFVGRSTHATSWRKKIGVGELIENYPYPVTLTTVTDDFNSQTAQKSGVKISDFRKPIILVIKKNVKTLETLYNWLSELNADRSKKVRDIPMLVIDDEADHASINTNKEDTDPTKTNRTIRKILSLFTRSCYVGYTATPFANIFINPDDYDDEVREDLFPRHFIHCLAPPTTYFGAQKIFLGDEGEDTPVRLINDCEELIPLRHKKDHTITELPGSLHKAIREFVVARALRILRGQQDRHCSMMINVSRFVDVQRQVGYHVSLYVKDLKNAILPNYALPEDHALSDPHIHALWETYDQEFANAGFSWLDVQGSLYDVVDRLAVRVINGKSGEVLDYENHEQSGLTVIAIGGLSLSRGLTLEGLTVSYMYRSTRMYDTLMQMGRWFGYRPNFEDLCRIHLSSDATDWYAHIARAADDLIQQIHEMRRNNMSPEDFGLYVCSHPDSLMITAYNKMRSGETVTQARSYSAQLVEMSRPCIDSDVNKRNFNLIKDMCEDGFGGQTPQFLTKGIFFENVATSQLLDFIRRFQLHPSSADSNLFSDKLFVLKYLLQIQNHHASADVVLISPSHSANTLTLNSQRRKCQSTNLVDGKYWHIEKNRVASRGDECLGLTDTQIAAAARNAPGQTVSDLYYRLERKKPLLMIHSLLPREGGANSFTHPVATFGVSFPFSNAPTDTIEIKVNRKYFEQLHLDMNMFEETDDDE